MKNIIGILLMIGFLLGQSSETAKKVIQLAGAMETYSHQYESGKIGMVNLTADQKEALARQYEVNVQAIIDLLQGKESVVGVDYSMVYGQIGLLYAEAESRFYKRYDFYLAAKERLETAKDFLEKGQPVDALVDIDWLLSQSGKFYSALRADTVSKLEAIKTAIQ